MIIVDSLVIMLLGMVGIFIVMGIIYFGLKILHRMNPADKKEKQE